MNRLECTVTSCENYGNGYCARPAITVEGPGAVVAGQTCCLSFTEKTGALQNAVSDFEASPETTVHCRAGRCQHNRGGHCRADCVRVGSCQQSPHVLSQTECDSFRCRE